MALFRKKEEEEDFEEDKKLQKKEDKENKKFGKNLKDLNSKNKKKRKEPPKPWGKKERFFVLIMLLATVITALIFAAGSRGIDLNVKKINMPDFNFNFDIFGEKTIILK